MPLNKVPAEILKEILSHLPSDIQFGEPYNPDLCAAALTCRYISPVAIKLLYSHIELKPFPHWNGSRATVLSNSCRENPALIHCVRSVALTCTNPESAGPCNEILDCLAKSTSLEKLKLSVGEFWEYLPVLFRSASNSFPRLSELEFTYSHKYKMERTGDNLPGDYIVKLCELPALNILVIKNRLEHIRLPDSKPDSFWTVTTPPKTIFKSLTELDVKQGEASFEVLKSVLTQTPNLKRLSFKIFPKEPLSFLRSSDPDGTLCRSTYADILAPVATCLETLVIDQSKHLITPHGVSRFDLSSFTNLSTLTIESSLLLGPGKSADGYSSPQEIIWELLPPCLRQLHVLFSTAHSILWSLGVDGTLRRENYDLLRQEKLEYHNIDWLLDLLDRCRRGTIAIKKVRVTEDPLCNEIAEDWPMTDLLRTAAREAGVALTIKLAVHRLQLDMWRANILPEGWYDEDRDE
ncbi:hypothetical protein F4776DRAFT_676150 [Hypoxylon sp. NC0597]|nr:hypothetical protein F4776DRAFT_676150 [Hypoxylon sp. NC0597]